MGRGVRRATPVLSSSLPGTALHKIEEKKERESECLAERVNAYKWRNLTPILRKEEPGAQQRGAEANLNCGAFCERHGAMVRTTEP